MKFFIQSLIVLAGAGLGLLVGFALRSQTVRASKRMTEIQVARTGASESSPAQSLFPRRHPKAGGADDSPLVTQLERDLSMSSGVTRWLYWLEALEKATPADCPRLVQLAGRNSPLLRLVGERWVKMNPQHMFDTLVAKQGADFPVGELKGMLFDEWSKKDVNAVIAALGKGAGSRVPENWRRTFAGSLVQKDPERGLPLMAEWHIDTYSPQMNGVKKWAAADPLHAAEFALAHPAGYASRMIMETIGKEWARTDPAQALSFVANKRGELGSALAGSVLKEWTNRNLNDAADWLAKTDPAARNHLSPAFVEGWAKHDAASALKWCEANLTGITFANAAASLVKGAAPRDLAGAAELVNSMAPSPARGEAATALMQNWLPNSSSEKPAPPEAIAWLKNLDPESINRVLDQTKWSWSQTDPKGFAAFVATLNPERVPSQIYSVLARNMVRKNPMEALDWASRLPDTHSADAISDAFSEWQRSQPELAMKWLTDLPPASEGRQKFFESAVRAIAQEQQAVERLTALSPSDRAAARKIITTMVLPEDHRTALMNALKPRP